MKTWTAHLREDRPPELLREGFSWGAFFFGPFWLAVQSAWVPASLVLAAAVAVGVLIGVAKFLLAWPLFCWIMGIFGNDLRRWALHIRGYTLAHVVAARDADTAFTRLLTVRPDLAKLVFDAERK